MLSYYFHNTGRLDFLKIYAFGCRAYTYICVDCVSKLANNILEAGLLANKCLNVMFPTTKKSSNSVCVFVCFVLFGF